MCEAVVPCSIVLVLKIRLEILLAEGDADLLSENSELGVTSAQFPGAQVL